MRELTAEQTGTARQPIDTAFATLRDLERYPSWYPATVRSVDVLERDEHGGANKVDVVLEVAAGPLHRSLRLRMAVRAQPPTLIALERIADDRGDHERFTITWRLEQLDVDRTRITVQMAARLDLPPLLPVGRIAREVAKGFLDAALVRLA